jgi:hypothetical protein
MNRLLCIILCLASLACNKPDTPETFSAQVHANQTIAYRFEIKPGEPSLPDQGFSLIKPSGEIDLQRLHRLKKRQAVLDQSQIKKLESAVYGNHPNIHGEQSSKHDFISLARLCDEIGIGMTHGSAEDQI